MHLNRIAPPLLLTALVAAVAACGTTDSADTARESTGDPVTVVDGRGEEVTLADGPATRVVTLEWAQTEMMVSLGIDPVGVADPDGYDSWVGSVVPLREETADVGVRREPSVDAVVDLEPDLIIGVIGSIPDESLAQMERIAPVVLMQGADAEDPVGAVRQDFQTVATLVGQEAEAEAVLGDFDAQIAANAAEIDQAGLAGTPVVLSSPFAEGANLTIRMHGPRSAPQQVADLLGLEAAWTDPGDDEYGLSNTDIEGLTELPDDTRFLTWCNDDSEDVVESQIAGNAVWESLPFVRAGHVSCAGVGVWVYGGPASLAGWSDDLVTQLTR